MMTPEDSNTEPFKMAARSAFAIWRVAVQMWYKSATKSPNKALQRTRHCVLFICHKSQVCPASRWPGR